MLAPPCYVISDAHLGAGPAQVERQVTAFLRHLAGRAGSLLINGDLFDFWFEWRTVHPRGHIRVLAALAELCDAGVPVLMIAGNHDCWAGDVLSREVGLRYHLGPWRGVVGGWLAHVEHGDGLRGAEDRGYRALRKVLRHPMAVRGFRWLHPDVGSSLAHGSSRTSRAHRARDGGAALRLAALSRLAREPQIELVLLGHSHIAALEQAPSGGVYGNAGSWLDSPTYIRVQPARVELRAWTGSAEGDLLHALDRPTKELPRSD